MKRSSLHRLLSIVLSCGCLLLGIVAAQAAERDWPQWRGPLGTGVAQEADPPVEWSETKYVRWKVALAGKGHSTPIVWGDRIFLTTAVPYGEALPPKRSTAPGTHDGVPVTQRHEFVVIAINRRDGKILWQKTVLKKLPHEGGHYTGSLASNSLVVRAAHALMVEAKGAGFVAGHPAEKAVHEAMFFQVWSCPPAVASATLDELIR